MKASEEERKVAIRWAKLLDFQHKAQQEENQLCSANQVQSSSIGNALIFPDVAHANALAELRSNIATTAWNEAKAFCEDIEITWVRKADVVKAAYRQAADYAGRVHSAWHQLAEAKRTDLATLPIEQHELMVAATTDLMRAEREKHAWNEIRMKAAKNEAAALDSQVLKTKAAFEELRAAWEELFHNQDSEKVRLSADIIKAQAAVINESDPHSQAALTGFIIISATILRQSLDRLHLVQQKLLVKRFV
ncbi:MAG: hypothetical protein ACH346_06790 [Chthoniobacterales bacterium]